MSEQPTLTRRGPSLTPARLLIVLLIFYLIVQVKLIVLLLVLAILFATAIEGPVRRLEQGGMPRSASILSVYGTILLALVIMFAVFVPLISQEFREFGEQAPEIVDKLAEDWRQSDNPILSSSGYRLLARLRFRLDNPPTPTEGTAIQFVGRVGGVGLGLVAMFVIGFYWLMEKRLLRRLLITQFDDGTGERISRVWQNVEAKVGDWLRGQFILCLIIGVAAGIGYAIMGVRFWLLLAVLAAITELVPIIGPWIGGIPAVLMALLDSWQKALAVAVFLILLQFVENSILVPRIMKGAVGLSPLTVFVAVLAGAEFMGPLGALLAIPFAAALQVIITDLIDERQRRIRAEAQSSDERSAMRWRGIIGQFLGPEVSGSPPVPDDPGRIQSTQPPGHEETDQPRREPEPGRD